MIFKMASSLTLLLILFCLISQVSLSAPDRLQGREEAMSGRIGGGKQKQQLRTDSTQDSQREKSLTPKEELRILSTSILLSKQNQQSGSSFDDKNSNSQSGNQKGELPQQLEPLEVFSSYVTKYSYNPSRQPSNGGNGLWLELLNKKIEPNSMITGIIVTFQSGGSYDDLFRKIQQKSKKGTQVLVYSAHSAHLPQIYQAFQKGMSDYFSLDQMIRQILSLAMECPSCIVFNWECSSGYASSSVPDEIMFGFLKLIIDRGYMAMFSDFSLKMLISTWSEDHLGPNPFKKLGVTDQTILLGFDNDQLKISPSTQLKIVGELASFGYVGLYAPPGTIVYGVDSERQETDLYELQVLSVAYSHKVESRYQSAIGLRRGAAGHVLLKYKSGGFLLASMGHWIQLLKIDSSEQILFQVARERYGAEYAGSMETNYENLEDPEEKKQFVKKQTEKMIKQQSPASNMAYEN